MPSYPDSNASDSDSSYAYKKRRSHGSIVKEAAGPDLNSPTLTRSQRGTSTAGHKSASDYTAAQLAYRVNGLDLGHKPLNDTAEDPTRRSGTNQEIRHGQEHSTEERQHASEGDTEEVLAPVVLREREAALTQLQSADQVRLLDAIDRLRAANIQGEIHIPQIVVCGIQSSGKSAVLEAISHLPFPSGAGTNTRFATELILRKSSEVSVTASIVPWEKRDPKSSKAIAAYKPVTSDSLDDFGKLHKDARKWLQDHNPGKTFWFDRLKIEVTGPEQPHLTLIDLPGLISANVGTATNTEAADIRALVTEYIMSERAVVLAVFAAKIDVDNQGIADLIKLNEDIQSRTLGVITYIDSPMTNDAKQNNLTLALNQKLETGLGWHLVCNLDHEAQDRSTAARARHEAKHLDQQPWSRLDRTHRGIDALRKKLSAVLLALICQNLPELQRDMQKHVDTNSSLLEALGPPRSTPGEYRTYLTGIANKFSYLTNEAVKGTYSYDMPSTKASGATFFSATECNRLRDDINRLSDIFAANMRESWRYRLVKTESKESPVIPFDNPDKYNSMEEIGIIQFCDALKTYSLRSRGLILPAQTPAPKVLADVFRLQTVHWSDICKDFAAHCFDAVHILLDHVLSHVANDHTAAKLWSELVQDHLLARRETLDSQVADLLWPYEKSHPICISGLMDRFHYKEPWLLEMGEVNSVPPEYNEAFTTLGKAGHYALAAQYSLTDNLATIAIEKCLLYDLSSVLSAETISAMDDETLVRLGCESDTAEASREMAVTRLKILEEVIRLCRVHGGNSR